MAVGPAASPDQREHVGVQAVAQKPDADEWFGSRDRREGHAQPPGFEALHEQTAAAHPGCGQGAPVPRSRPRVPLRLLLKETATALDRPAAAGLASHGSDPAMRSDPFSAEGVTRWSPEMLTIHADDLSTRLAPWPICAFPRPGKLI